MHATKKVLVQKYISKNALSTVTMKTEFKVLTTLNTTDRNCTDLVYSSPTF
jgi:hypothetical protein